MRIEIAVVAKCLALALTLATVVDAPGGRVRCLEVDPEPEGHIPHRCEPAPPPIFVSIGASSVLVVDQGKATRLGALALMKQDLKALKDAMPEREEIVIVVDDDVPYERLVAVVDIMTGLELAYRNISINRSRLAGRTSSAPVVHPYRLR